jgi:hypothetical protein
MKSKYETVELNVDVFYVEPSRGGYVRTCYTNESGQPLYAYEPAPPPAPPSSDWHLHTALAFARQLNSLLAAESVPDEEKAHIAITGSVLRNGFSDKDLDLVVYPHKYTAGTPEAWCATTLARLGKYLQTHYKFCGIVQCKDYNHAGCAAKAVYQATRKIDNRKVDFFFLS